MGIWANLRSAVGRVRLSIPKMKQLLQSSFVLLGLVTVVLLNVINTCQIDQLEAHVLAMRQALDALGGGVPGAGPRGKTREPAAATAEAEALVDPDNLLRGDPRPFVEAPQVVRGGTLRLDIGQDPPGMNPYISSGADVIEYNTYINDTLAMRQRDDPDVWFPALAQSVKTVDEGLTYTVRLRPGVMWHPPTVDWSSGRYAWLRGAHVLTADDFAFVFDMLRNPQVAGRISSMRNYFSAFVRYEVVDRYTFKVFFSERLYTNLPALLSLQPMPRWLYMFDEDGHRFDSSTWGLALNQHWYNQRCIGTGPYRFVLWEPGVKIELAQNPSYWGEKPSFERIVMRVAKDQSAWLRQLKTQEIDLTQVQPEQYRTEVLEVDGPILGNEHIKMNRQPTLGYFYIGWHIDSAYFGDKRTRQAMTLAFNRDKIVRNVLFGLGKITSGPFAQQSPCYDKTVIPWPFDLALARQKLREAGWKDTDGDGIVDKLIDGERRPFAFTLLMFGSSSEYETLANIYREDLLQVGVRMMPRALEWSTMRKKIDEREFDAYTGAWVLDWDVDLYQLWHSAEADRPMSSNRIGFRNAEADRIITSLRRTFEPHERVALCHSFHRLLHEEQPYTFFYQRERAVLYWDYMNTPTYSLLWPYRDLRYFSFRAARP